MKKGFDFFLNFDSEDENNPESNNKELLDSDKNLKRKMIRKKKRKLT